MRFYFFGKKNDLTDRETELLKRVNFRRKLEVVPLAQSGVKEAQVAKKQEADLLLSKVGADDFLVAFDERGKEMDSFVFAAWLKERYEDTRGVVFVMGGAHGLGQKVLERANLTLRCGKMVWGRDLFRNMVLEQIYRAGEITQGGNFHKT